MLSPFDTYRQFQTMKLIFIDNRRDLIGKLIRIKSSTFDKHRNKKLYEFVSVNYNQGQMIGLFLSNLIYGRRTSFIGDYIEDDSISLWRKWRGKIQASKKYFVDDIKYLSDNYSSLKDILTADKKLYNAPPLLHHVLYGDITMETFIIIESMMPNYKRHLDTPNEHIALSAQLETIWNYKPFIKKIYNSPEKQKTYKSILKEYF